MSVAHRSQVGVNGAYFLPWAGDFVVAKVGPSLHREWLATQLAAAVGCAVAYPLELICEPPAAAVGVLPLRPHDQMLLMGRIVGQNFNNLLTTDRQALQKTTCRGKKWLHQMGRICALDYWMGNRDRFPAVGLGGLNRGNIMLSKGHVVAIDNTLATTLALVGDDATAQYPAHLRGLLRLVEDRHDAVGHRLVQPVEQFFSVIMETPLCWPRIAPFFVEGLVEGLRRIADVPVAHLERLMDEASDAGPINDSLKKFLRANRQLIAESFARDKKPPRWAAAGRRHAPRQRPGQRGDERRTQP